jgi:hypothetical protein
MLISLIIHWVISLVVDKLFLENRSEIERGLG